MQQQRFLYGFRQIACEVGESGEPVIVQSCLHLLVV